MTLREQLIIVSDLYGSAMGIGRARVSTIVLNRGSTLTGIAEGRTDLNTGTFERAMQWFSDHWPVDAQWPAQVNRPSPVQIKEAAE